MTCSKLGTAMMKAGVLAVVMAGVLCGVSVADEEAVPSVSSDGTLAAAVEPGANETPADLLAYDPWAEAESILELKEEPMGAPVESATEIVLMEGTSEAEESAKPASSAALNPDRAKQDSPPTQTASATQSGPEADALRPHGLTESDEVARLSATTLEGLKTLTLKQGVLIHLEADGFLDETLYFPVEDPDRLVVDLVGVGNSLTQTRFPVSSEQIRRIRVGTHSDKVRVVLDAGRKPVDFSDPRVVSSQTGLYLSVGEGEDLESAFSQILMGQAQDLSWSNPVMTAQAPAPAPKVATLKQAESAEAGLQVPASSSPSLPLKTLAAAPMEPAPVEKKVKKTDGNGSQADVADHESPKAAAEVPLVAASALMPSPVPPPIAPEKSLSVSVPASPAVPSSVPESPTAPARVGFVDSPGSKVSTETTPQKPELLEVFGLQFERNEGRDRVAILLDGLADYRIFEPDAETVMLQIPNARFSGDTGERITPESGGPVSLVTTFEQPDLDGSEVRVVMRRAKGLSPTITRRSTVIMVDFKNQGVAATAPPAFLPDEPAFLSEEETYANRLQTEGRLPSDASSLPGADVDPDTDPVSELEKGAAEGTVDSHALAAALNHAETQAAAKALAPVVEKKTAKPAPKRPQSLPAALASAAAVDVVSEGGLIDGKTYTGRRISLDFKDVLISDVLRLIAEVSELNIIAGDEVKGSITIRLVDVPWDQALDVILLTKGLGFVRVGNVLRIAPDEILKAEEESRLQERRQKEKLEDLEIKLQPINYADVTEMKGLVSRLLSPRGTVNVDIRTNTVIIKDISSVIDEAVALIRAIDTQTPQVMIEAKIVEANLDFARELGSTWSFGSQPYVDGFSPGALRTDLGSENFKFAGENNVVIGNPITSAATGTVNFGAFLLDDKMQVDVHIQAMEQAGEGKVISSPRVVTLDNREAIIEQGVSIPFQTFESGDAKLEFIDAVLSLQVTPHITTDKSIIMALEVARNAPDSSVPTPTGSPAIAKNQAKTETLVKDGQTLVIGGIYTVEKSTRESRVPYLSKIPFLGKAFKSRQVLDKRKELLIFVTPRIVVNPALASN